MAISTETRRSDRYACDGTQTAFPFAFKVFDATEVGVTVALDGETESSLTTDQYTVSLNADQDNSPGGTVTVNTAPASGTVLVVVSQVAYEQPIVITNNGGFYPALLNEANDRSVILSQQLKETLDRALIVPVTQNKTPAQVMNNLLDAANTATIVAKGYAEAAAASAADAKQSRDDILDHKQGIVDAVTAEGDKQNQRLVTEGDTQIGRIKAETDNTLIANGMGCAERFWTLSADTPAGTDITIPSGIKYLVNRHHLRVAWNGLVLAIGQNFTEVGAQDTFSSAFRLTFDAKAGDEIDVWIGALGKGDVAEALALAGEASAAVAELSRKVVYKEEV
jgi:hypothetical protein